MPDTYPTVATIGESDGWIQSDVGATPVSAFQIDFPFFGLDDVTVEHFAGGLTTVLQRGVDFNIAGTPDAYGVYPMGTVNLFNPVTNCTITRYRTTGLERASNFPLTGYFDRASLNTDMNREVAASQDLRREEDLSIRFAEYDWGHVKDLRLPLWETARDVVICFDVDGKLVFRDINGIGGGIVGPPGPPGVTFVGPAPPALPAPGTHWWNSTDGNLYIWYQDANSSQWVPSAVPIPGGEGPPGAAGPAGPQGPQGIPGLSGSTFVGATPPLAPAQGTHWWNTTDGNLYLYYFDGNSAQWVPSALGAEGPVGPAGPAGSTGATGAQGPAGAASTVPGPQGPQGVPGATGATGAASTVPGPAGPQGPIGNTGSTGAQGPQGNPGSAGATGAQGPQGNPGTPGSTGAAGPTGAAGLDGNTVLYGTIDPTTIVGIPGNFYINTTTHFMFGPKGASTWPAGTALVGPQGIQGIQGPTGNTGATGATSPPSGAAGGDLAGTYPNPTIKVPATLAGGTVVANSPVVTFTQTWNNAAVAFTAKLTNIVATAKAAASYVERWQVGGADIAYLDWQGNHTTLGYHASVLHHWSNFTTPLPAGGAQDLGYLMGSAAHFGMIAGSGPPTATMARGSLYLRSDGAPYYNEAGTGVWSPVNAVSQNAQGSIGASNVVCGVGPTAVCNTGSIGANGQVWEIMAKATYCELGGGAGGYWGLDIWNGSVAVDNASNYLSVSGGQQCSTLMAIVTLTAATTFSLRLGGPSSFANGLANCCRITAKRLS